MRIVNLTPYPVNVLDGPLTIGHTFPISGTVARFEVVCLSKEEETVGSTVISTPTLRFLITGLPAPRKGVGYIVSAAVVAAARATGRQTDDLFVCHDIEYDDYGHVVGCYALARG